MNQLYLLKLIAKLLEGKPSDEKIDCARNIVDSLIEAGTPKPYTVNQNINPVINPDLDPEAQQAMQELQ